VSEIDGEDLARALRFGCRLVYVHDRLGAATLSFVAGGVLAAGSAALVLDVERLPVGADVAAVAQAATRAARLEGAVLVAGPVEALAERDLWAVRAFAEADVPTVLIGSRAWDPAWSRQTPLLLHPPDIAGDFAAGLPFRLTPEQAERARAAAELHATAMGEPVTLLHLAAGARAQNASGLERLALRISPAAGFDDLVLPEAIVRQLRDIVARVRYRSRVLGEWGMRRAAGKGRGVTALFAGDSGTGKTLSAEVVAGALGLDLYVIDLATVVDKYIGETEKNLDRIFREADRVNGVLLFDEADAIFGKRSEVHDARDRYANVEVAYLLQRMERFDGIAVLTTNLRANLDDAFLRRLDALVDFPTPDEPSRRLLWDRHLPRHLLVGEDVDLDFLARAFDLPGGNIRNIAVAAAFLAAADDRLISMVDLIRATAREYRKLGRLCVEAEFGPYFTIV
jgi:ATPase family associated with various cellular activities (AAA)